MPKPKSKPKSPTPLRAKLIFNPIAGPADPDDQLDGMLHEFAHAGIQVDVYRIHPGSRVRTVVGQALKQDYHLILAAGGDNTIGQVAAALSGTKGVLGILPTGTRNNIALSLGVPTDLSQAIRLLRRGHPARVDMLRLQTHGQSIVCLEMIMNGLGAALFPAADQLQKGNLTQLGGLVSTLVTSTASHIRLTFDRARPTEFEGQLVIIANMPYVAANNRLAPHVSPRDGKLDIFLYPDLGKFELITYAAQLARGGPIDPRIQHHLCRTIHIESNPPLALMADGVMRGSGSLTVTILPGALKVMLPK